MIQLASLNSVYFSAASYKSGRACATSKPHGKLTVRSRRPKAGRETLRQIREIALSLGINIKGKNAKALRKEIERETIPSNGYRYGIVNGVFQLID